MLHRFVASSGAITEFSGDGPFDKARKREEILSAQLHAIDNVAELFQIFCKARYPAEARKAICAAWGMTEFQAQIISEMQVQRFTQIERLKMRDELAGIREFIAAQGVSPRS